LARVLADNRDDLDYLMGFIKPGIFAFIPFGLIILQNDLGTSLVLVFVFIVMLYAAGGNVKFMWIIFGGSFALIVLMILFHIWLGTPLIFLKEYQLNRLIVFINPGLDPYGIGYNILQSKIAIGSGMIFGKGLFGGTQNQLNFLPEKHTDFIFSVIGEEFGFLGILIVLALYFILFWHLINIANESRDRYGRLVVTGITAMFFFHLLQNAGMTMGIMPITGIPLPFISYGGSSMVTSLIAIGIVLNINTRKKKIMF
jgi:rod shape determining protein RodA